MININPGERLDELERKGYKIIQNSEKFCFGMDAVLLSAFAKADKDDVCIDLGTGTGIIPILMEARYDVAHLTGLEIQEESADMARRSVIYNNLQDKIDIVTGDIKEASSTLEDVVREATLLLKPGGRFCMVHRPHRLIEIITCLKYHKMEPKRIRLVHPYADKEANMVLIESVRGGKPYLKVMEPLIVYNENGEYTEELLQVYRE